MAECYRPPNLPESFPVLETIADDHLENLIETDDHFGDLFHGLSEVRAMRDDITMLRVMNKTAAEAALQREPELARARQQLADSLDTLQALHEDYQSNRQRLESYAQSVSTDAVWQGRQVQCAEQEAAAQTLAEVFLDGGLPPGEFIPAYLEQRQRAAVGRVRVDKLREILAQPSSSPSVPQGSAISYAGSSTTLQQHQQHQQHQQATRPASWFPCSSDASTSGAPAQRPVTSYYPNS